MFPLGHPFPKLFFNQKQLFRRILIEFINRKFLEKRFTVRLKFYYKFLFLLDDVFFFEEGRGFKMLGCKQFFLKFLSCQCKDGSFFSGTGELLVQLLQMRTLLLKYLPL